MARYKRQCFCNLLDNATEAAKRGSESYVEINISRRKNTPFALITVVNSCRVNPFRDNEGILISTEPDKHVHGFGIKSIQKVCKNYDGDIQIYYSDNSLTFHTIITIRSPMSHSSAK